MRFARWFAAPKTQVWANGALMFVWFVSMPIAVIIPALRTSILFVALVSLWANLATHLGAWIAALVKVRAQDIQGKTEEMVQLEHIEALEERIMAALGVD